MFYDPVRCYYDESHNTNVSESIKLAYTVAKKLKFLVARVVKMQLSPKVSNGSTQLFFAQIWLTELSLYEVWSCFEHQTYCSFSLDL